MSNEKIDFLSLKASQKSKGELVKVELSYNNSFGKDLQKAYEVAGLEIELLQGDKIERDDETDITLYCEESKFQIFLSVITGILIKKEIEKNGMSHNSMRNHPFSFPINLN